MALNLDLSELQSALQNNQEAVQNWQLPTGTGRAADIAAAKSANVGTAASQYGNTGSAYFNKQTGLTGMNSVFEEEDEEEEEELTWEQYIASNTQLDIANRMVEHGTATGNQKAMVEKAKTEFEEQQAAKEREKEVQAAFTSGYESKYDADYSFGRESVQSFLNGVQGVPAGFVSALDMIVDNVENYISGGTAVSQNGLIDRLSDTMQAKQQGRVAAQQADTQYATWQWGAEVWNEVMQSTGEMVTDAVIAGATGGAITGWSAAEGLTTGAKVGNMLIGAVKGAGTGLVGGQVLTTAGKEVVSSLVPMAIRVAGNSYYNNMQVEGAKIETATVNALVSSCIEVATEKMSGIGSFRGEKGFLDSAEQKFAELLTKNTILQNIVAGFMGEGLEEAVSDLMTQAWILADEKLRLGCQAGIYNQRWDTSTAEGLTDALSEIAYDFFVGGVSGALGGVKSGAMTVGGNYLSSAKAGALGAVTDNTGFKGAWDGIKAQIKQEREAKSQATQDAAARTEGMGEDVQAAAVKAEAAKAEARRIVSKDDPNHPVSRMLSAGLGQMNQQSQTLHLNHSAVADGFNEFISWFHEEMPMSNGEISAYQEQMRQKREQHKKNAQREVAAHDEVDRYEVIETLRGETGSENEIRESLGYSASEWYKMSKEERSQIMKEAARNKNADLYVAENIKGPTDQDLIRRMLQLDEGQWAGIPAEQKQALLDHFAVSIEEGLKFYNEQTKQHTPMSESEAEIEDNISEAKERVEEVKRQEQQKNWDRMNELAHERENMSYWEIRKALNIPTFYWNWISAEERADIAGQFKAGLEIDEIDLSAIDEAKKEYNKIKKSNQSDRLRKSLDIEENKVDTSEKVETEETTEKPISEIDDWTEVQKAYEAKKAAKEEAKAAKEKAKEETKTEAKPVEEVKPEVKADENLKLPQGETEQVEAVQLPVANTTEEADENRSKLHLLEEEADIPATPINESTEVTADESATEEVLNELQMPDGQAEKDKAPKEKKKGTEPLYIKAGIEMQKSLFNRSKGILSDGAINQMIESAVAAKDHDFWLQLRTEQTRRKDAVRASKGQTVDNNFGWTPFTNIDTSGATMVRTNEENGYTLWTRAAASEYQDLASNAMDDVMVFNADGQCIYFSHPSKDSFADGMAVLNGNISLVYEPTIDMAAIFREDPFAYLKADVADKLDLSKPENWKAVPINARQEIQGTVVNGFNFDALHVNFLGNSRIQLSEEAATKMMNAIKKKYEDGTLSPEIKEKIDKMFSEKERFGDVARASDYYKIYMEQYHKDQVKKIITNGIDIDLGDGKGKKHFEFYVATANDQKTNKLRFLTTESMDSINPVTGNKVRDDIVAGVDWSNPENKKAPSKYLTNLGLLETGSIPISELREKGKQLFKGEGKIKEAVVLRDIFTTFAVRKMDIGEEITDPNDPRYGIEPEKRIGTFLEGYQAISKEANDGAGITDGSTFQFRSDYTAFKGMLAGCSNWQSALGQIIHASMNAGTCTVANETGYLEFRKISDPIEKDEWRVAGVLEDGTAVLFDAWGEPVNFNNGQYHHLFFDSTVKWRKMYKTSEEFYSRLGEGKIRAIPRENVYSSDYFYDKAEETIGIDTGKQRKFAQQLRGKNFTDADIAAIMADDGTYLDRLFGTESETPTPEQINRAKQMQLAILGAEDGSAWARAVQDNPEIMDTLWAKSEIEARIRKIREGWMAGSSYAEKSGYQWLLPDTAEVLGYLGGAVENKTVAGVETSTSKIHMWSEGNVTTSLGNKFERNSNNTIVAPNLDAGNTEIARSPTTFEESVRFVNNDTSKLTEAKNEVGEKVVNVDTQLKDAEGNKIILEGLDRDVAYIGMDSILQLHFDNDFDGDTAMILQNKSIVELIEKSFVQDGKLMLEIPPVYYKHGVSKAKAVTTASIVEAIQNAFQGANIGQFDNTMDRVYYNENNRLGNDVNIQYASYYCGIGYILATDYAKTQFMPESFMEEFNKIMAVLYGRMQMKDKTKQGKEAFAWDNLEVIPVNPMERTAEQQEYKSASTPKYYIHTHKRAKQTLMGSGWHVAGDALPTKYMKGRGDLAKAQGKATGNEKEEILSERVGRSAGLLTQYMKSLGGTTGMRSANGKYVQDRVLSDGTREVNEKGANKGYRDVDLTGMYPVAETNKAPIKERVDSLIKSGKASEILAPITALQNYMKDAKSINVKEALIAVNPGAETDFKEWQIKNYKKALESMRTNLKAAGFNAEETEAIINASAQGIPISYEGEYWDTVMLRSLKALDAETGGEMTMQQMAALLIETGCLGGDQKKAVGVNNPLKALRYSRFKQIYGLMYARSHAPEQIDITSSKDRYWAAEAYNASGKLASVKGKDIESAWNMLLGTRTAQKAEVTTEPVTGKQTIETEEGEIETVDNGKKPITEIPAYLDRGKAIYQQICTLAKEAMEKHLISDGFAMTDLFSTNPEALLEKWNNDYEFRNTLFHASYDITVKLVELESILADQQNSSDEVITVKPEVIRADSEGPTYDSDDSFIDSLGDMEVGPTHFESTADDSDVGESEDDFIASMFSNYKPTEEVEPVEEAESDEENAFEGFSDEDFEALAEAMNEEADEVVANSESEEDTDEENAFAGFSDEDFEALANEMNEQLEEQAPPPTDEDAPLEDENAFEGFTDADFEALDAQLNGGVETEEAKSTEETKPVEPVEYEPVVEPLPQGVTEADVDAAIGTETNYPDEILDPDDDRWDDPDFMGQLIEEDKARVEAEREKAKAEIKTKATKAQSDAGQSAGNVRNIKVEQKKDNPGTKTAPVIDPTAPDASTKSKTTETKEAPKTTQQYTAEAVAKIASQFDPGFDEKNDPYDTKKGKELVGEVTGVLSRYRSNMNKGEQAQFAMDLQRAYDGLRSDNQSSSQYYFSQSVYDEITNLSNIAHTSIDGLNEKEVQAQEKAYLKALDTVMRKTLVDMQIKQANYQDSVLLKADIESAKVNNKLCKFLSEHKNIARIVELQCRPSTYVRLITGNSEVGKKLAKSLEKAAINKLNLTSMCLSEMDGIVDKFGESKVKQHAQGKVTVRLESLGRDVNTAQLLDIYMALQDEGGRAHIKAGGLKFDKADDITSLKEQQFNSLVKEVETKVREDGLLSAFAEMGKSVMGNYEDEVRSYRNTYLLEEDLESDPNYWHLTVCGKRGVDVTKLDYDAFTGQCRAVQSRSFDPHMGLLITDFFTVLDKYTESVASCVYFEPIAQAWSNLLSSPMGVGKGLTDTYGEQFSKYMYNFVADITGARQKENTIFRKLMHSMAGATLTLNGSVAMKQKASLWNASYVIPMKYLAKRWSVPKFSTAGINNNEILENIKTFGSSNVLESRRRGYDKVTNFAMSEIRGQGEVIDLLTDDSNVVDKIMNALPNATKNWIPKMDYQTVSNVALAAYDYVKDQFEARKMEPDGAGFYTKVAKVFNEAVLKTQPFYMKETQSELQRNPSDMWGALGMFRTQQTQNFNNMLEIIINGGTAAEALGKSGIFASAAEFSALTMLATALKANKTDDDDYLDDDGNFDFGKLAARYGANFASGIMGTCIFGDKVSAAIVDVLSGGDIKSYDFISVTGIEQINNVMTGLTNAIKNPTTKNITKEAGYIATVAGIPLQNAINLVQYAVNNAEKITKTGDWAEESTPTSTGTTDTGEKAEEVTKGQAQLTGNPTIDSAVSKQQTNDMYNTLADQLLASYGMTAENTENYSSIRSSIVSEAKKYDEDVAEFEASDLSQSFASYDAYEQFRTTADTNGNGSLTQNEIREYATTSEQAYAEANAYWDSMVSAGTWSSSTKRKF